MRAVTGSESRRGKTENVKRSLRPDAVQPGRRLADAPCDPVVGCCTPRASRVERSSPPSRVLKAFHHTFTFPIPTTCLQAHPSR